jgi:hypothetical protein
MSPNYDKNTFSCLFIIFGYSLCLLYLLFKGPLFTQNVLIIFIYQKMFSPNVLLKFLKKCSLAIMLNNLLFWKYVYATVIKCFVGKSKCHSDFVNMLRALWQFFSHLPLHTTIVKPLIGFNPLIKHYVTRVPFLFLRQTVPLRFLMTLHVMSAYWWKLAYVVHLVEWSECVDNLQ